MRTLAWILGIPLVLILGAVVFAPALIHRLGLVEFAAGRIEASTGAELELGGKPSLSLLRGVSLAMPDVTVTTPDGGTTIRVRSLEAGLSLRPLLAGSLQIDRIALRGAQVTSRAAEDELRAAKAAALDTSALGRAELDAFYAARGQLRRSGGGGAAALLALPFALEVGELRLEDSVVSTVSDSGETLSQLTVQSLRVSDVNSMGRPTSLDAAIVIEPGGGRELRVDTSATFAAQLREETIRLDEFAATVRGALDEPLTLRGRGQVELGTPAAQLELLLGSSEGNAEGTLGYTPAASPVIDAQLRFDRLTPRLLALTAADPGARGAPPSGEAGKSVTWPLELLRTLDTRTRLEAERAEFGGVLVESLAAELRIREGVVTLSPARGTLYGGALNARATLDAHYNDITLAGSGSLQGAELSQAVAAFEVPVTARGKVTLAFEVTGSGADPEAMVRSLAGPLTLDGDDVVLENIGLERELCRAVAQTRRATLTADFARETPVERLSARVQFGNGTAKLESVELSNRSVRVDGTGRLALLSRQLEATLGARLGDDFGAGDPACRVDDRLAELRWPVRCQGTLGEDPATWCSIDLEQVIRKLAEDRLRRKTGKLLDRLLEQ